MLKKVLLIFLILVILISAATFVVNRFVLPSKIKALIVNSLAKQTQKNVKLESVEFSIFRGLVLKNLVIFDKEQTFVSIKDADCTFLPLPFLKKKIIVPWINIRQAEVYIERRSDNAFNISDFFNAQQVSQQSQQGAQQKKEPKQAFGLIIKKINIRNSVLIFKDSTLQPVYNKVVEGIDANIYLALPAQVKFNLKTLISSNDPQPVSIAGIYNILNHELGIKLTAKALKPSEFGAYLSGIGIKFNSGKADIIAQVQQKGAILNVKIESQFYSTGIVKDKIKAILDSGINADISYNFDTKDCRFSGQSGIKSGTISGIDFIGSLCDLTGIVRFDNKGVVADNIQANALGMPVQGKFKLEDFNKPKILAQIFCTPDLEKIPELLKRAGKFSIPLKLKGSSKLNVYVSSDSALASGPLIKGVLEFNDAVIVADMLKKPITSASGKLNFTLDSLEWKPLKFIYDGIDYSSTGTVTNFKVPDVVFTLKSENLFIDSELIIKNTLLNVVRCNAKYLNSECSFSGGIDIAAKDKPKADLDVQAKVSLNDLNKFFAKQLQKIKPDGVVDADFSITGDLSDIKSCLIGGTARGKDLHLYGLKADDFNLAYSQQDGMGSFKLLNMGLYSGFLQGTASVDYNSKSLPFSLKAKANGVEIEQLKNDTGLKKNDLAGTLSAEVALDGAFDDAGKLNGAGKISIANGRLWQLNLFQGMGKLIFAKDFANIDFKDASCFFTVSNKLIKSDNILMNSDLAQLAGSCRIGFDSSLSASINVQVSDKMIPITGTFKDVATAIIGSASRFGVITITGTLQNPKYQFKTAVVDIMKSVTDAIFR
ncbi:MAG: AsmA family protein [Candidatus Omnitrophica bacterium]|nr:AsmA family protein [Candidatus Omnitrophota bacterium]